MRFCDWEQFRFLFYQFSSFLTPVLLFDIQMLPADLTQVRRMFYCGQYNRRRNRDRKQFTLTTDHEEEGGRVDHELRRFGPHAALGQSMAPQDIVRYTGVSAACWHYSGLFLLLGTKNIPPPRSWACCSQNLSASERARSLFDSIPQLTYIDARRSPCLFPPPLPRIRRHRGLHNGFASHEASLHMVWPVF